MPPTCTPLDAGRPVARARLEGAARWTPLVRSTPAMPEGYVELGEICRVHRGQVTGANATWVVPSGQPSSPIPDRYLFPSVTRARELIDAGERLESTEALRRVIDLPANLAELDAGERDGGRRLSRIRAGSRGRRRLRRAEPAGVVVGRAARAGAAARDLHGETPARVRPQHRGRASHQHRARHLPARTAARPRARPPRRGAAPHRQPGRWAARTPAAWSSSSRGRWSASPSRPSNGCWRIECRRRHDRHRWDERRLRVPIGNSRLIGQFRDERMGESLGAYALENFARYRDAIERLLLECTPPISPPLRSWKASTVPGRRRPALTPRSYLTSANAVSVSSGMICDVLADRTSDAVEHQVGPGTARAGSWSSHSFARPQRKAEESSTR